MSQFQNAKYIAKYLAKTVNFKWSNTVCGAQNSLVYILEI